MKLRYPHSRCLLTFRCQSHGGARPVAVRKPLARAGRYCMRLRRFLVMRVRSLMLPAATLARPRLRLDHRFSVGFNSGA